MRFERFVGDTFLNGRAVVVYTDGDDYVLRIEDTAGRVEGRAIRLSPTQYEALRAAWFRGGLARTDVRATSRALTHLEGQA